MADTKKYTFIFLNKFQIKTKITVKVANENVGVIYIKMYMTYKMYKNIYFEI